MTRTLCPSRPCAHSRCASALCPCALTLCPRPVPTLYPHAVPSPCARPPPPQEPETQDLRLTMSDKDIVSLKALLSLKLKETIGGEEVIGRSLIKLAPVCAQVSVGGAGG